MKPWSSVARRLLATASDCRCASAAKAGERTSGSAQTVPAAPRIHDGHRGQLGDAQEILIAGDEKLGPTRHRRGEHPSVVRIAQREIRGGGRSSDDRVGAELVLDQRDLGWRHLEPLAQDPTELREIDFPGQQLVLSDDEAEQVSAEPACREGADEDVRGGWLRRSCMTV